MHCSNRVVLLHVRGLVTMSWCSRSSRVATLALATFSLVSWSTTKPSQQPLLLRRTADCTVCHSCRPDAEALRDPCLTRMRRRSPDSFRALWQTNYGRFEVTCVRARAPVWVDRLYNLLAAGFYDDMFFLRVVNSTSLKVVQFGTAGDPTISRVYNWSTTTSPCGILEPQPDVMPFCTATQPCPGVPGLSNTFGTLSMSTSFNERTKTTWNATSELFINTGDNSWLDAMRFVPICDVDAAGMATVLRFPSFGELSDLGGSGPSLGRLYEEGNSYITGSPEWGPSMARAWTARLCTST